MQCDLIYKHSEALIEIDSSFRLVLPCAPWITFPAVASYTVSLSAFIVDGQWQEWSSWSHCSVTCSNGTQQRSRQCTAAAHGGSECRGPWAESRECYNPECTGKANCFVHMTPKSHTTAKHHASSHKMKANYIFICTKSLYSFIPLYIAIIKSEKSWAS